MTRDEVLSLYDRRYAATYDAKFLHREHYREATAFELAWLRERLQPGMRWLDVACGTGWFLSQFPEVPRCGLDLAPAMLEHARRRNPGIELIEGDFRDPHDTLRGKWDLVTSMWWAYVYAGSVAAVDRLIRNLARWTAEGGSCFFPICDPEELCQTTLPTQLGGSELTAIVWDWTDEICGTRHEGLISPHLQHLTRVFASSFETVDVIDYPKFDGDAVGGVRRAIWARGPRGDDQPP